MVNYLIDKTQSVQVQMSAKPQKCKQMAFQTFHTDWESDHVIWFHYDVEQIQAIMNAL